LKIWLRTTEKRLSLKGINFIVAGKLNFCPELLIDLKKKVIQPRAKQKREKLLPSAQFLLIYHIIHRNESEAGGTFFKEIAQLIRLYTNGNYQMPLITLKIP